jgi:multidrug efflux system membrane fusion protein
VSKIEVTLDLAATGTRYKGLMQSFDNRLNPASGTLRARAVFKNEDGTLVPGLFARVRVGSATAKNFTLISDKAVGTDQSKKFVYVVGADNKVEYREVQLGDTAGNLRIVKDGLKPGEKIIIDGVMRAHPGAEVKPELVSMDGAAPAPATAPAPAEQAPEPPVAETPAAEIAPVTPVAPATSAPAEKPADKSEETKQ